MVGEQRYIGVINLASVRDFILDNDVENKTIWLHPHDYDIFGGEYVRNNDFSNPIKFLGVEILRDITSRVVKSRIFIGVEGELYPDAVIGKVMRWKIH